MNRRRLLAGGLAGSLLAGLRFKLDSVGAKDLEKPLVERYPEMFEQFSYEGFPLICKACGKPLTLLRSKLPGGPVSLGCMECSGTPVVTGGDWDSVVKKWIEVRALLSRDMIGV